MTTAPRSGLSYPRNEHFIAEIGLLLTAFTAPSIVRILLVGVLADRVGRRTVITGGCSVSGPACVPIARWAAAVEYAADRTAES